MKNFLHNHILIVCSCVMLIHSISHAGDESKQITQILGQSMTNQTVQMVIKALELKIRKEVTTQVYIKDGKEPTIAKVEKVYESKGCTINTFVNHDHRGEVVISIEFYPYEIDIKGKTGLKLPFDPSEFSSPEAALAAYGRPDADSVNSLGNGALTFTWRDPGVTFWYAKGKLFKLAFH